MDGPEMEYPNMHVHFGTPHMGKAFAEHDGLPAHTHDGSGYAKWFNPPHDPPSNSDVPPTDEPEEELCDTCGHYVGIHFNTKIYGQTKDNIYCVGCPSSKAFHELIRKEVKC
jgi:hypothetical protein